MYLSPVSMQAQLPPLQVLKLAPTMVILPKLLPRARKTSSMTGRAFRRTSPPARMRPVSPRAPPRRPPKQSPKPRPPRSSVPSSGKPKRRFRTLSACRKKQPSLSPRARCQSLLCKAPLKPLSAVFRMPRRCSRASRPASPSKRRMCRRSRRTWIPLCRSRRTFARP